ncbi:FAS1 domain-containing protein [Corynespora cassiicola Philippines]|uniref:FAS1 domain-containing protein n=1 Tax=Corynespora cassiicola Philippines TaxID=1448308 RepID=A0A2T2NAA9_CORCC|nr:FAS1 domain-containing protein [Corynespora cassiicola Philippines]
MKTLVALCATFFFVNITAKSLREILSDNPSLSIFKSLLQQFRLFEDFSSLENVTLIAPTDQAYLDLAQWGFNLSLVESFIARALLQYHVLEGTWHSSDLSTTPKVLHTLLQPPILTNVSKGAAVKLWQEKATNTLLTESGLQVIGGIEKSDIQFDNGVLHMSNSSLVLPHNISATAELTGFPEFLSFILQTELVPCLESLRDVTVFMPSNSEFLKLKPLLGLLGPHQVKDLLLYHFLPNEVLYRSRMEGESRNYTTLQGAQINIHSDDQGAIQANGVKVIRSDIMIYGGVAHELEGILVPPSEMHKRKSSPGVGVSASYAFQILFQ